MGFNIYKRKWKDKKSGELVESPNWTVEFMFKGRRIHESIGPSQKDAEKVIAKKKTEIIENQYLDIRKDPDPITLHAFAKEYLQWGKDEKKASTYNRDINTTRGLEF